MYKLLIASKARKEIRKISRTYQEAILTTIKEIREDPFSGKPLTRELTGKFSYRVGVFRIIYKINKQNKTVFILFAGHRSVIYD